MHREVFEIKMYHKLVMFDHTIRKLPNNYNTYGFPYKFKSNARRITRNNRDVSLFNRFEFISCDVSCVVVDAISYTGIRSFFITNINRIF